MTEAMAFLKKHRQTSGEIDIEEKIEQFIADMKGGLSGKGSCLPMIPTYLCDVDRSIIKKNVKRILIDAGGTNFRTAVGYFDDDGNAVVKKIEKTVMPASDRYMSKKEFYWTVANNVAYLLPYGGDVGFCFSYQVDMDKDIDGTVMVFSKEVKAPEVVGTRVGRSTLDALEKIDGKKRRIVILNDTVATLLGGMASNHEQFSSYIGYIYGTGTNICYMEDTENITKVEGLAPGGRMLINTECGNFDKFVQGDYDKIVAEHTVEPTRQLLEKMTSGRYLGDVAYQCLRGAAKEGVFKDAKIGEFKLKDVSAFISGEPSVLDGMFANAEDADAAKEICMELVDRAAKIGAIMNASAAIVSAKGTLPVAIVAEGTTFDRLPGYRKNFEKYLDEILGKRGIAYKIIQDKELNLVGTLMATMVLS